MSIFGAAPRVAEYLGLLWTQRHGGERVVDLLAMLVEADEMSPDEADAWLDRLRIAESDDGDMLPDLAPAIDALVQQALADAAQTSDRWHTAQQTVGAVAALGALPPATFAEWYRRLGSPAPAAPVRQLDERTLRARAARPGELERVVAGPVRLGPAMQVTSAEIYEGAVALRWHYNSDDARFPRALDMGGVHFRVEDELGTQYIGRSAGAGRLDRHEEEYAAVSGRDVFVPAPPREASALLVHYDGDAGRLQLRA
jgi:hypothetical protein